MKALNIKNSKKLSEESNSELKNKNLNKEHLDLQKDNKLNYKNKLNLKKPTTVINNVLDDDYIPCTVLHHVSFNRSLMFAIFLIE